MIYTKAKRPTLPRDEPVGFVFIWNGCPYKLLRVSVEEYQAFCEVGEPVRLWFKPKALEEIERLFKDHPYECAEEFIRECAEEFIRDSQKN